jgi:amidase
MWAGRDMLTLREQSHKGDETMLYRRVTYLALASSLALAGCSKTEPAKPYAVEEVPLARISADLAAGKTTAVAVTKAYIERIKAYDGPLHSVIMVAPDALDQAAASDKRRKEGKALGPLDGIPILLKDNIDATGMPTTAGSFALAENLPTKDSEVARRLRASGVIILGKNNMSQWAGWRGKESFSGSTVGGGPHNPYDLTRTVCGSSSGSGIATAVSFAAATVGSDTTGSVICPSSLNGIVGLRPTVALISRRGVVPLSSVQDTTGPMARSVTDTAMLLTSLAGSDAGDPASRDSDAHKADYVKGLSTDALKGKRLGVLRSFGGYNEKTQPLFDAALEVLKAQGAELVEVPDGIIEDLSKQQYVLMTYDFKPDLAAYLKDAPPAVKIRSVEDLVAFQSNDPREKMHTSEYTEESAATTGRDNPEYVQALEYAKRKAGPEGYDKAMADYNVSALIMPTRGPADVIPPDGTRRDRPTDAAAKPAPPSSSGVAALAGYPDLTVPMGDVEGLPVGLSFIGPAWSEQMLLSYGYAYEQASKKRVPPEAYKKAVAQ